MTLASIAASATIGDQQIALRDRAREIENMGFQLEMVRTLIGEAENAVGHRKAADIERAEAILVATGHMVRAMIVRVENAVDRMLDASEN